MNLYERRFDTDWDSLDREEATERAFALGVAASLGERDQAEYEALVAEMDSNYHASMVELAYEEGRQKASERKRAVEDAADAEVFEFVVSAELDDATPPDRDEEAAADRATDLPSAVSNRTEATDKPDPDPEQTDFPDFLE